MSEKLARAIKELESSENTDEQQRALQHKEDATKRQEKLERFSKSKNQVIDGAKHFGMLDKLRASYYDGRDEFLKRNGMRVPYRKSGNTELMLIPKIVGNRAEKSDSDHFMRGEDSGLVVFGVAVNSQTGQESEAAQIFAVWAKTNRDKEQVMVYDEDYQPAPKVPGSHHASDMFNYYGGYDQAWQPLDVIDPASQDQVAEFESMLGCIKGAIADAGEQQAHEYAETIRA